MDTNRIWFITGASSGFGRIWTQAALAHGDGVVATARNPDALDDLAARYGDRLLALRLDVTDRDAVFATVASAVERVGHLDVVVNNAGYGHLGMVEELTEAELRDQLETNFFGAVWVTQAVLPVLRRQGGGRLLQVTSEGGVRAFPGIGAYHASKWALEGISESLRQEVATFGVHVTCLEPGPYATGFLARGARRSSGLADYDAVREVTAPTFVVGDPQATWEAVLALVDAPAPPARLVLGAVLPEIVADYERRLSTWREWQAVSEQAFGRAGAA